MQLLHPTASLTALSLTTHEPLCFSPNNLKVSRDPKWWRHSKRFFFIFRAFRSTAQRRRHRGRLVGVVERQRRLVLDERHSAKRVHHRHLDRYSQVVPQLLGELQLRGEIIAPSLPKVHIAHWHWQCLLPNLIRGEAIFPPLVIVLSACRL